MLFRRDAKLIKKFNQKGCWSSRVEAPWDSISVQEWQPNAQAQPPFCRSEAKAKRRLSALLGLMRPVVDDPHLENYG